MVHQTSVFAQQILDTQKGKYSVFALLTSVFPAVFATCFSICSGICSALMQYLRRSHPADPTKALGPRTHHTHHTGALHYYACPTHPLYVLAPAQRTLSRSIGFWVILVCLSPSSNSVFRRQERAWGKGVCGRALRQWGS